MSLKNAIFCNTDDEACMKKFLNLSTHTIAPQTFQIYKFGVCVCVCVEKCGCGLTANILFMLYAVNAKLCFWFSGFET